MRKGEDRITQPLEKNEKGSDFNGRGLPSSEDPIGLLEQSLLPVQIT